MAATPQSPDNLLSLRYLTFTNFEDGITATAGGGQSGAYQLSAQVSVIDTVATPGDSVVLPKFNNFAFGDARPGGPGMIVVIFNEGANPCQVFGVTADTINAVATATGVTLAPGATMFAWPMISGAVGAGDWFAMISPNPTPGALLRYASVPIGSAAYSGIGTNTADVNGQVWVTSIYIPIQKTITKLGFLQGGTATTDNTCLAIYNSAGTRFGNTPLTGVGFSRGNTFHAQALATPPRTPLTLPPGVSFLSVH